MEHIGLDVSTKGLDVSDTLAIYWNMRPHVENLRVVLVPELEPALLVYLEHCGLTAQAIIFVGSYCGNLSKNHGFGRWRWESLRALARDKN